MSKLRESIQKINEQIEDRYRISAPDSLGLRYDPHPNAPDEAYERQPNGMGAIRFRANDKGDMWVLSGRSDGDYGCTIWYIGDDIIAKKNYDNCLSVVQAVNTINNRIGDLKDSGFEIL